MSNNIAIGHRMENLFKTSQWHDMEFYFEDDQVPGKPTILMAHRLILASVSEVFEALCYGPLASESHIVITDIDAAAFRTMLRYFYTDDLIISSVDQAFQLLYAAQKYIIPSMSKLVGKYLLANLLDSNCIELYNLADLLCDETLKNNALQHICRRLEFVQRFFCKDNLTLNLLSGIVQATEINCKEITLAILAEMWAKNTCTFRGLDATAENMRNLLVQNNIYQHIRWNDVLSNGYDLLTTGLIPQDEISTIMKEEPTLRKQCPSRFTVAYMAVEDYFRVPFLLSENTTVTTSITVNISVGLKSIILMGKGLPPNQAGRFILSHPTGYEELLEVTVTKDNQQLAKVEFREYVAFQTPFHISLSEEVILRQDQIYDINIRTMKKRDKSLFAGLGAEGIKNPQGLKFNCMRVCNSNDNSENFPEISSFIAGFFCSY